MKFPMSAIEDFPYCKFIYRFRNDCTIKVVDDTSRGVI
jgi:hypothetical protein